ncbi:MAG: helix-turn-helix transcriptional regulator [Bacteroidetes bacterium]|nr:helix-turn-helix transcriptional regulator [Bacteroidota bacterium]
MQVKNKNIFKFRSDCPISSALDLIGDKWSILIIRDLCFFGKRTFSELSLSDEKIAANILADRLKKLEEYGILTKGKSPENKKTVLYTITQKGLDFVPVILDLVLWGARHLDSHISAEAKQFAKKIKKDKDAVIMEVNKKLASTGQLR